MDIIKADSTSWTHEIMTHDLHIGIREKLASMIYVTGITMWRDDNDIRLFSHHGHCGMVAKNRASGHHNQSMVTTSLLLDSSHPQRLCRYLSVLESAYTNSAKDIAGRCSYS